jgi:DNA repair exonuclease SbcCD ATPase subunit
MEDKLRALEAQQRAEETELADWTRLAADLGRQGLQAAEIDGCGPELTALVNDLLHSAHGPRFTVRIDTQKLSADGKKTLEGCQVTVIDTVRGREDEGSKFSGGERVIIGEALALGLSMLACQRSGLRGITLVRDETGAALDPQNAEVYVRMLRRAAEQVGADRVLFVCHNPEVAELADARVTVIGGRIVVDAPARRAAA